MHFLYCLWINILHQLNEIYMVRHRDWSELEKVTTTLVANYMLFINYLLTTSIGNSKNSLIRKGDV